jgi:hypothetical protein
MSLQNDFAAALLDPQRACPDGLKSWNGSDPAKRFDVYRNNVTSSLIDALADTFPVLQMLVGEEFFRAMARVFVQSSPPTSPMLVRYGASFAEFVQDFAPAQTLPYLADMARLEFARVQAYHAADAQALAHEALVQAMSAPEQVAQLQFTLHPSLQVLRSAYAVVSLWAAHQTEHEVEQINPDGAQDALIVRSAWDVQIVLLPHGAAAFVLALMAGSVLGLAAAQALEQDPGFDLSNSLALLLRLGAITALA